MERRFSRVQVSQIHVVPRALTSIDHVAGSSSTEVPQREQETQGVSSAIPRFCLARVRRLEGC